MCGPRPESLPFQRSGIIYRPSSHFVSYPVGIRHAKDDELPSFKASRASDALPVLIGVFVRDRTCRLIDQV